MAERDVAVAEAAGSGALARARRGVVLCDGEGSTLALDPSSDVTALLIDACRLLLAGEQRSGASMVKVSADAQVYLVSRGTTEWGEDRLRIADLYDPSERVVLPTDVAEAMLAMIEQLRSAPAPGVHRWVDG